MKTIDFSQPGGFPIDQEQLDWLQQSYLTAIRALAGIGGADNYIISGCELTGSDPDYTVSEGWIWFNNEVYYCGGGSFSTILEGVTGDPGFVFQEAADSRTLDFFDGSTPEVLSDRQAIPGRVPYGSATTSTRCRYVTLKRGLAPYSPYSAVFEATASVTSDSGAVDYDVKVKARMHTATKVIEMAVQVLVTGANAITVTLPDWRAVDTTIDLPWNVEGCAVNGVPTALLPICTVVSSGVTGGARNNSGAPVAGITAQVFGTRLWISVPKMHSAFTNFAAIGRWEGLEFGTW